MDVTSNDLICNGGINPYHQPISTAIITAAAGSQVTAEWHHSMRTSVSEVRIMLMSIQRSPVLIQATLRTLLIPVTKVK